MTDDRLTIRRPKGDTLTVSYSDGKLTLTVSGGSPGQSPGAKLTPAELDQIAAFAEGKDGAEAFVAKVRARAAR